MPKATLTELLAEGMTVYPPGMRGLAAKQAVAVRLPRRGMPATPIKPEAGRKFAHWIKAEFPALYADAAQRSGFAGLAIDAKAQVPTTAAVAEQPSALQRFVTTITNLAPQYLQYQAQKDLLEVQLDRARQGLPPLRPTDYAPAVQLSVDPAIYTPQLEALKPWLLYGGLALGGFLLFRMLGGSGRRR